MAKKINLTNLQKDVNEKFPIIEKEIQGYKVRIHKKFRPTIIRKLVQDLIEQREYIDTMGYDIDLVTHASMLTLKYFTDAIQSEKFDIQIQIYWHITNL